MRCRFPALPLMVALLPPGLPAARSSQGRWGYQRPKIGRHFREQSPVNRCARAAFSLEPAPDRRGGHRGVCKNVADPMARIFETLDMFTQDKGKKASCLEAPAACDGL